MNVTPSWNPAGHPIHRLIQYLDAAITAFNHFSAIGRFANSNIDNQGFSSTNKEETAAYWELYQDYCRVVDEIFVKRMSGPSEVTEWLNNDCIAYFVRNGGKAADCGMIRVGCEELGRHFLHPKGDLAFNVSTKRFLESMKIRDTVFSSLALLGEVVPEEIRRRLRHVNMENDELPSTEILLGWVRCAEPSEQDITHASLSPRIEREFIDRMLSQLANVPPIPRTVPQTGEPATTIVPHSHGDKSPANSEDFGNTQNSELEKKIAGLPNRVKAAYLQFKKAEHVLPDPTDRVAYDWLQEDDETHEGLPGFETWSKYLREARAALGEQKNKRRTPPPADLRSAVRFDELE